MLTLYEKNFDVLHSLFEDFIRILANKIIYSHETIAKTCI